MLLARLVLVAGSLHGGGTFWPAGYYLRLEDEGWFHLGYGRFEGIAGGGARMLVDEFPKPQ